MSLNVRTNKRHKKLMKAAKSIESDFGVTLSPEPTKFVLLSNAGLANGGLTSSILKVLPRSESLPYDIALHPNKTFAVVRCPDIESATALVESLDDTDSLDFLNGQHVHAGFLDDDVPNPRIETGPLPRGLRILEDALSPEDEVAWLKLCSFTDGIESCTLKNRQVEHFGYRFDYGINGVPKDDPLLGKPVPEICNAFLRGLIYRGVLSESDFPNQLTVNRYDAGAGAPRGDFTETPSAMLGTGKRGELRCFLGISTIDFLSMHSRSPLLHNPYIFCGSRSKGIPAHCDTHSMFSSCIVVVSFGSAIMMDFRRDDREVSVLIPRRSVTMMTDESRYAWTHSIAPRKCDLIPRRTGAPVAVARGVRTSFTFRRVRDKDSCDCEFPTLCDSRLKLALDDSSASHLERLHVHEVYDNIASHFSDTRHTQWPRVVTFLRSLPKGSLVVDVGCGNGKYMRIKDREDLSFLGCDRSGGLLNICRRKSLQVLQVDCLALPFRERAFDAVICIAVIHHLSTIGRRKQAIQQMLRLLKKNGKLLISVWALDQNVEGNSKYLKGGRTTAAKQISVRAGSTEVTLPVHTNRSAFSNTDVLVPWKKAETMETQQRYYHVFEKGELKLLVDDIEGIEVRDEYYDEGNWCLVIEKTRQTINEIAT